MYVLGVTITLYYIPLFAFGIRTALFVENCTLNNRTYMTYSGVVAILPLIKPVIHSVNYTMISYENKTYDYECAEKKSFNKLLIQASQTSMSPELAW